MELINISQQILINIKKIIDREVNNDKKAVGFSQLTQWYATGKMTKGQMQKIISFYDNYSTGNTKDLERKKIYDELHLLPWCKNQIEHIKRVQNTLRKVHQYTGTNRTVDRLIKPSSASVRAPKPVSIKDMLRESLVLFVQQKAN